jgi:hypothetical protein
MRTVAPHDTYTTTSSSSRFAARRRLIYSALLVPMLAMGCAAGGAQGDDADEAAAAAEADEAALRSDRWIDEQIAAQTAPPEYDDPLAYFGKNRRDPIKFTTFIEDDPNSDKHILFDEREQDDFGNRRWGAGYNGRVQIVGQRHASLMHTTIEGEIDTRATLFDKDFDVVRINAVASSSGEPEGRQEAKVTYQIYLYGKKLADSEFPLGGDVVDRDIFRQTQPLGPSYSQTFILPPAIPVKVSARALATEYIHLTGNLAAGGIDGTLTPGARVFAEASAGVGGSYLDFELSAGLRGRLTLLSADVPVTAGLKWDLGPAAEAGRCVPILAYYVHGELVMRELDGTVDIYAKACAPRVWPFPRFCYDPSKRIGGWEAFEQRHQLFESADSRAFPTVSCGFVKPGTPSDVISIGNPGPVIPTGPVGRAGF